MSRYVGKCAVVTGAAGGIGSAIARRLAHEGARVVVADIDLVEAVRIADEIGKTASAVRFDAYDAISIQEMIAATVRLNGRLDVLVNNVADTSLTKLDRDVLGTDIETFDRSISSNLRSIFIATKAALPHLIEVQGAIVNISSGAALAGDTWLTSYAAAKSGVLALTRNTAVQYGKLGVRCNSICPGFIAHGKAREMMPDTVRTALAAAYAARNGKPEDIAALAAYLGSDEAGFVNGENVVCDGGHAAGATPWRGKELNAL